MPAFSRLTTQFIDDNGDPLLNGYLYIGAYSLDPVANPITIYSDLALTTPLANPQRLDSYGRPENDIYVGGNYSYKVTTSAGVQIELKDIVKDITASDISYIPTWTGAVDITLQGILSQFASLKDFGAALDNTTDDLTALNAAIAAINANEFRHLFVPQGNCRVTGTPDAITLSHCTIFGLGRSSRFVMDATAGTDGTFFTIGSSSGVVNNCTITGLAFGCDNVATLGPECVINVVWAADCFFSHMFMEEVAGGFKLGDEALSTIARTQASRIRINHIDLQMYGAAEGTGLDLQWANGCNIDQVHGLISTASVTGEAKGIHIHPVGTDPSDGTLKTCDGNKFFQCEFNYPGDGVQDVLFIDSTNGIVVNEWFTDCVFDHSDGSGIHILIDTGAPASARINNLRFTECRSYINGNGSVLIYNPGDRDINNVHFNGGVLTAWDQAAARIIGTSDLIAVSFDGVDLIDLENTTPKAAITAHGIRYLQVHGCKAKTQRVADTNTFTNLVRFTANVANWSIVGNDCIDITGIAVDVSNCTAANGFKKVIANNLGANQNPPMYVPTTDATIETVGSGVLPEGRMVEVRASVVARKTDDSAHEAWELVGTFYRPTGGSVTQIGTTTTVHSTATGTGWTCVMATSAQQVNVRGTGAAATAIDWYCDLTYRII